MKYVGLSGSLRPASLNSAVIRSAAELCTQLVSMTIYEGIGTLPFFHEDVEAAGPPPVVMDFRARLATADAVLIASPEYAHGMSGVLKNALEWVVGGGELVDKPVAVVTASPMMTGGNRAQAWTQETLRVMGARVLPESLPIPLAGAKIRDGRVIDGETLAALKEVLEAMARAVKEQANGE
jgi:chromate reductase, NAD(P)H dehydrogenase (quinone)